MRSDKSDKWVKELEDEVTKEVEKELKTTANESFIKKMKWWIILGLIALTLNLIFKDDKPKFDPYYNQKVLKQVVKDIVREK